MSKARAHIARFTPVLVPVLADALRAHLKPGTWVIDPFAGTGERLAEIGELSRMNVYGIELTRQRIVRRDIVKVGDATKLAQYWRGGSWGGAVTSPMYGNGMCDYFVSTDDSVRNTVVHNLRAITGNPDLTLPRGSTARWLFDTPEYRDLHLQAYRGLYRVLKRGGVLVLNTKNCGDRRRGNSKASYAVTAGHIGMCLEVGFEVVDTTKVPVNGLRHGANRERAVDWEDVTVLRKK